MTGLKKLWISIDNKITIIMILRKKVINHLRSFNITCKYASFELVSSDLHLSENASSNKMKNHMPHSIENSDCCGVDISYFFLFKTNDYQN